jgi:hypothetical protein
MKKHNRHIALVLLTVIIYPYISQSLHVLNHDHGHMHIYGTTAGTATGQSCTSTGNGCFHHNSEPGTDEGAAGTTVIAFEALPDSQSAAPCTLCEHEFARFFLTRIYKIVFHGEMVCTFNPFPYNEPSGIFTFSHISLRAPPHVS